MRKHGLTQSGCLIIFLLGTVVLSGCAAGISPRVWIDEPRSGSQYQLGATVDVQSHAASETGVRAVVLLVNGQEIRRDQSGDRSARIVTMVQSWVPQAEGQYTLQVVAYTSGRVSAESDPVQVTVGAGEATPVPAEPPPEPTSPPSATPTPAPGVTPAACVSDAAWVSDVTVPDGTEMSPGERFEKVWRLRNTGDCAWGDGYQLVSVSGASMAGPEAVAVPATAPGETADIGVTLQAPSMPGTYTAEYRLADPAGQQFGSAIRVVIVVPGAPAPTSTPSGTEAVEPTPAPTEAPTEPPPAPTDTPPPPPPTDTPEPEPDTVGPGISNVQASADLIYTAYPGGCSPTEVTISARVTDPSGIDRVRVAYRVSGGEWEHRPMTAAGGDKYQVTLSSPGVPTTLEYYVQARDTLLNQSGSPHKTVQVEQCSP